jgi:type I restriction enzyme S subunit
MSNLPAAWLKVPIGQFARIVGGGTPPSKNPANFASPGNGIPWLTPADLSGYRAQTVARGSRDLTPQGLSVCGATLLPKGSVLFSSRAPIGYVAIAANELSTSQGFKSFILPSGFDSRFCYYQLKHLKPDAEAIATGTTFKELSGAAAARLTFAVAPWAEQTRIADQLDTLLASINACNDRLDAIPGLLKRLRQAVLETALSGDLTAEWRDGAAITKEHWKSKLLGEIAEVGTGSTPLRSNGLYYADTGTPWITSAATGKPYVLTAQEFVTPVAVADHRLKVYPPGTLLIAMYGEGKTRGQVTELKIHATINQACAAVKVDESQTSTSFVKLALWVQYEQMRALAEGGNQPNLNLSKVRGIPIQLPPLQEQVEIVSRVDSLFQLADRIEARCQAMCSHTQRLAPQVLVKAFRGELLPQDPNDEPAEALLARIAAERASPLATAASPRPARKPRAAYAPKPSIAMTKSRQDKDVKGHPYLAGHLSRLGQPASAEALFKVAELPVDDFYKQLAWEVAQGLVKDNTTTLEPGHAAG